MTKIIKYKGKRRFQADVMAENGISRQLLSERLKNGWTFEAAISFPPNRNPGRTKHAKKIKAFGEIKSLQGWAKDYRCKISYGTLRRRLKQGQSIEEAMVQNPNKPGRKTILITAFGETKTIKEWVQDPRCKTTGAALRSRFLKIKSLTSSPNSKDIEEAIITGPISLTAFGETKTIEEWAKDPRCKTTGAALRSRFQKITLLTSPPNSKDIEEAIITGPIKKGPKACSVTIFGETKSLTEWTKDPRCKYTYETLRRRLVMGEPFDHCFKQLNYLQNGQICAFGETKTIEEWARDSRCAVSYKILKTRLEIGMNGEKAISTPIFAHEKGID